jgi:hypothetical protein
MTLVSTNDTRRYFFHGIEGDEERGTRDEGSYGNDVGEHSKPASGVTGTSSACYPSHPHAFKFT